MVSENIIRKIDSLGRITLPKGLRDRMGFIEGTEIEILTDKDVVCLRKAGPENSEAEFKEFIETVRKDYVNKKISKEVMIKEIQDFITGENND
jgi:AbrB family looped-hinge helix DNA binding protein